MFASPRRRRHERHSTEDIITAPSWCLFLDVDGTLLDIAATPGSVHVPSSLLALLERVDFALAGALALVSGRPIAQLDRLFAPRRWPAAGMHGLERRDAAGQWHARDSLEACALQQARAQLGELSQRLPGILVEDKGVSIAVHYRQAPQHEAEVRREVAAAARELGPGFHLLDGRMVLELRPRGTSKAGAIRDFLQEAPFNGRRPIFVGDDVTDVEALLEVERLGGLSVAVGDNVHGMLRVSGPRDVRVLLQDIAEHGGPT